MNIRDMLKKEFIITDLEASGKQEAIEELVRVLTGLNGGLNRETMVRVLLEREKLGSTGIGDGVAIPHGKMPGIEKMIIGFGRSKKGVDFNALDGRPVHLFFILIAPDNSSAQYLRVLARLSRMLKEPDMRDNLLKADSSEEIYSIIGQIDQMMD